MFPVVAHRATCLPPTRQTAESIDAIQRRMVSGLLLRQRLEEEDENDFHRRRQRESSCVISRVGRWSDELLMRSHAWDAHARRGSADTPAHRFLKLDTLRFLEALRRDFILAHGTQGDTIGVGAGRFGQRLKRGRPAARWEESLEKTRGRCKQLLDDKAANKRRPQAKRIKVASESRKNLSSDVAGE